ncbi:MAG: hypothetical protein BV459_01845 [Thermoplasmata archaeon M11B2D]|nr:MAG: hypothetical protein BV459_01845 [Thermoplasmata archaeon M11B2D]
MTTHQPTATQNSDMNDIFYPFIISYRRDVGVFEVKRGCEVVGWCGSFSAMHVKTGLVFLADGSFEAVLHTKELFSDNILAGFSSPDIVFMSEEKGQKCFVYATDGGHEKDFEIGKNIGYNDGNGVGYPVLRGKYGCGSIGSDGKPKVYF